MRPRAARGGFHLHLWGTFDMRKASVVAFVSFFALHAFDAWLDFGWQAVDLPPARFFLFSCWVAVRNTVAYTFLFTAPVFLLGRRSRWVVVPSFAFCVIVEAAVVWTGRTFHASLGDIWFDILENTNAAEIAGFLSMASGVGTVCGAAAVAAAVALFGFLMFKAEYPAVSKRTVAIGIGCLLPFLVLNCALMNWHFGVAQTRYSHFCVATAVSWERGSGVRSACKNRSLPVRIDRAAADAPDVVIVLGESSTRRDWHLYGYPRSTTPCLDALAGSGNLVVLEDVVGSEPDTVGALSLLLTDVSFDDRRTGHWTLAEVYRKAGFRCSLISQQCGPSDDASTLFRIFNGCERRFSVGVELGVAKAFDGETIPLLERELASGDGRPGLVFVHLAGMHYPVQGVNPPEDDYFSDETEPDALAGMDERTRDRVNRYDNAIRYEDKVLGGMVAAVSRLNRPTALFFISDHGESPRAPSWRDFRNEDVYMVPAFVWFSDEYIRKFPSTVQKFRRAASRPVQPDELTHALLDLGRIGTEFAEDSRRNFLHEDFRGRSPRMIDKGRLLFSGG